MQQIICGVLMKKAKEQKKPVSLWRLFFANLILSGCTFGGGFVIISMMKKKFVEELGWLEEEEMLDMAAIAQSAPGSLAVNASIVVGYRILGIGGAAVSALATVIPPLVIISVISVFYNQFCTNPYVAVALQVMRAGVAAVIVDVVISLGENVLRSKSILWIGMMVIAFVASAVFGVNSILIILICGTVGFLHTGRTGKEKTL